MGGLARDQARARVDVTMRRAFVFFVGETQNMETSPHNRKIKIKKEIEVGTEKWRIEDHFGPFPVLEPLMSSRRDGDGGGCNKLPHTPPPRRVVVNQALTMACHPTS